MEQSCGCRGFSVKGKLIKREQAMPNRQHQLDFDERQVGKREKPMGTCSAAGLTIHLLTPQNDSGTDIYEIHAIRNKDGMNVPDGILLQTIRGALRRAGNDGDTMEVVGRGLIRIPRNLLFI